MIKLLLPLLLMSSLIIWLILPIIRYIITPFALIYIFGGLPILLLSLAIPISFIIGAIILIKRISKRD